MISIRNKQILDHIQKLTDDLTSRGPEACRDYLISIGIYNSDGSLSANYGGEMKADTPDTNDKLMALCLDFVKQQRIYCPETIAQSDRVIENAYDFIQDICNIVGYYHDPEDDCDPEDD